MDSNQIVEEQNKNDKVMKRAFISANLFFFLGSIYPLYLTYLNVVEYINGASEWLSAGNGINTALLIIAFIIAAPVVIVYLILSFGFTTLKVPALIELGIFIVSLLIFWMPYMINAIKRKKSQENNK